MSNSPSSFLVSFQLEPRFRSPLFHPARDLIDYPNCKLVTSSHDPFALPPQSISITEILYSNDRTTVYAGRYQDETEVVLKFTSDKDVLIEAAIYDHLINLQGSVIPQLHGVLYGDLQGGGDILCLAMERFGGSLDRPFVKLDTVEKYAPSLFTVALQVDSSIIPLQG